MIEKVVETWHRFVAGELPEAPGRSAGGRHRLLLADRGGIRLMDRHSARSATREGRDHRPNRKSQFKSARGTRFTVPDKEGARCRSGCQRG